MTPPVFLSAPQEADESLNFEEQILEAAKSIAAATSALVKAASAAQRELVAQGKVGVGRLTAAEPQHQQQGQARVGLLEVPPRLSWHVW